MFLAPTETRTADHQSSDFGPEGASLEGVSFSISFSGAKPAFRPTRWERACARVEVAGARRHAARTMSTEPPANTASIERSRAVGFQRGRYARAHNGRRRTGSATFDPASQTPVDATCPRDHMLFLRLTYMHCSV